MADPTGSISVLQVDPFFVHHDGSVAVVYHVRDIPDAHAAAAGLIDALRQDGEPVVVIVDHRTASVLSFPLARLTVTPE